MYTHTLIHTDTQTHTHCFITLTLSPSGCKKKTKVVKNNCNPVWNEVRHTTLFMGRRPDILVTKKKSFTTFSWGSVLIKNP